ncbi:Uncharacterised protein [Mycobacteroides abscessus subsp. abscessus]|nr:Uncharacterised protein [Mycobacteroides abscessus subsp. abscessus]
MTSSIPDSGASCNIRRRDRRVTGLPCWFSFNT